MRRRIQLTHEDLMFCLRDLRENTDLFTGPSPAPYLRSVLSSVTALAKTEKGKELVRFTLLPAGARRFGLATFGSGSIIILIENDPWMGRSTIGPNSTIPVSGSFLQLGSHDIRVGLIEQYVLSKNTDITLRHCNFVTRDATNWEMTHRHVTYRWGPRAFDALEVFTQILRVDCDRMERDHEKRSSINKKDRSAWEHAFRDLPGHLIEMME